MSAQAPQAPHGWAGAVAWLSNLNLEQLAESILADLSEVCSARSGALWLADDSGRWMLQCYRGLDKSSFPERIRPSDALKARLVEGVLWLSGEGRGRTLSIPLAVGGEQVGLLQLTDPSAGDFSSAHIEGAQGLIELGAIALRNARRMFSLQRLALRDRDTAAYNLSYFTDYASKEIYKARRFGRMFSLLVFSIDNLPQLKLRQGADEAAKAARAVLRAFSEMVRQSDVLAKSSEQEFYLLLPETDYFGAMMFARRALAMVREASDVASIEASLPLGVVSGEASFPGDGDDFDELLHKCRERMQARRLSLSRKLFLDGLKFWEQVEVLLGNPSSPRLPSDERAEPSRRGVVSESLFDELQAEIARDLLRVPASRGVVYVGAPEIRAQSPLALGLEAAPPELAARIYALGRRADLQSHRALTPVFLEGDDFISRHEFLLWLSESSAYALIQRRGRGAVWGFHSCDGPLVDGLVSKLQQEYDLQPY